MDWNDLDSKPLWQEVPVLYSKTQVGLYLARSQANEQLSDALGLTAEKRPSADKFSRSGRALRSGEMDLRPNV